MFHNNKIFNLSIISEINYELLFLLQDSRLAMCEELGSHVKKNQVMLEHQQFDLIVRLLNAALQVQFTFMFGMGTIYDFIKL